jgi:hypothetical protein
MHGRHDRAGAAKTSLAFIMSSTCLFGYLVRPHRDGPSNMSTGRVAVIQTP